MKYAPTHALSLPVIAMLTVTLAACGGNAEPGSESEEAHTHEDGSSHTHGDEAHTHDADTSATRLDTSGMASDSTQVPDSTNTHDDEAHSHDDGTSHHHD